MSERPRVLILAAGLEIGAAHGGAERFALELACALRGQAEVSLCAFWQRGGKLETTWLETGRAAGLEIFFAARWQGRWNLTAYRGGLAALIEWCRRRQPDLIHSHFQAGTLAALDLKRRGLCRAALRTAHITREWGSGPLPWLLRGLWNGLAFPLLLSGESGVSPAICRGLDARISARLAGRKALLLANALPRLEPLGLPSPTLDPALTWVGGAGRLCEQKDPLTLLRAFALLAERRPELRLAWAGDGPLRPALLAEAQRLGVAEKIALVGALPGLGDYLRQLRVFGLPSRYEGLPTVLLEAAECGLPAAASDIPGARELAAAGFDLRLCPPGDPPALAAAIEAALTSQPPAQRADLSAFRFERAAQQCLDWYQQILGENGPNAAG